MLGLVVVKGGVLGVLVRREEGLHWLHERGLDMELGAVLG
jgi:hypothetical protein